MTNMMILTRDIDGKLNTYCEDCYGEVVETSTLDNLGDTIGTCVDCGEGNNDYSLEEIYGPDMDDGLFDFEYHGWINSDLPEFITHKEDNY